MFVSIQKSPHHGLLSCIGIKKIHEAETSGATQQVNDLSSFHRKVAICKCSRDYMFR